MKGKKFLSTFIAIVMVISLLPGVAFASESEISNNSDNGVFEATRTDFRDESVYSLLITRFYDGDSGNNVHCWDDRQAGNPDSDPAWRGDFKGLVEKLDYIKALGFTAVRLNPVAQNASGYDYHGEHPINLKEIDFRYESDGYTYEDLVNACHSKGLKVMQEVVLNSTSNFGEEFLRKLFDVNEDADWSDAKKALTPTELLLKQYPNYLQLNPEIQFQARLDMLKAHATPTLNADEHYHREKNMGYESSIEQQGSLAGDNVDINTENPKVALYLAESCYEYAKMGVDAIMILDAKHINRWTFNEGILPFLQKMLENEGLELEIFYEVVSHVQETWNHNIPSSSVPFFSWAETEEEWIGNWDSTSPTANIQKSIDHYDAHRDPSGAPTSTNAFLDGLTYHTPDHSLSSGMNAYDFTMMWNFENAGYAFTAAKNEDQYFNDSTWNLTSMDTWNYGPGQYGMEKYKLVSDTTQLKENLSLMFTFRGIPGITAGTEIEFQKGKNIDVGANAPLSTTARAYYGDNLEGEVETTDFGVYTANGTVANTLNSYLSQHIQTLNKARQMVPALRKGQYTVDSNYVNGSMAFIRRYTDETVDSLALVTISDDATFKNIPSGKYVDVISGNEITVADDKTLTVTGLEKGEVAIYVCCADGFTTPDSTFETEKYTASFDANGGEGKMDDVISQYGYITLPECAFIPPEGKIFKGWSIGDEKYGAGSRIKVTENVSVKALWGVAEISFDANGGFGVMAELAIPGGDYVLPQCGFTAPYGMSFKAWSINGIAYAPETTVTISADTKIIAQWQNIVMTLTTSGITATGLPEGAKLILASYGDSGLIDVKAFDITDSDLKMTYVQAGLNCDEAKTIKSFLWNNMAFLVPLSTGSSVALGIPPDAIYFKNTEDWSTVNAYCWSDSFAEIAQWPGKQMTNISGTDIWYIEIPDDMNKIIFNNGSAQTGNIEIPTNGNNLYTYSTGSWSKYN